MSIPNIIHKIKSKTGIDKVAITYLCIIIGVGVGSFGLGRLSLIDSRVNEKDNIDITKSNIGLIESQNINDSDILVNQSQTGEKNFVASKNGKMYYRVGCSGAKRIKPENEVWFNTKEDAEKSGYALSSLCK